MRKGKSSTREEYNSKGNADENKKPLVKQQLGISGIGDQLRSMLASQGKASGSNAGDNSMIGEAMRDMRVNNTSTAMPGATLFRESTQRSRTPTSLDTEFDAFRQGTTGKVMLGETETSGTANSSFVERAWSETMLPQRYASAPVPVQTDTDKDAAAFFTAFENEGIDLEKPTELEPIAHHPMYVQLVEDWRPPSPSGQPQMMHEQYAMHERLARLQAGIGEEQPYRIAEKVQPPEDDAELHEGVYAPTTEQALASVWDTQATREQRVEKYRENKNTRPVSDLNRYTQVQGQAIVDKLRGWLVREGYTSEVYGLPPLATRIFGEAVLETRTEKDEELRALQTFGSTSLAPSSKIQGRRYGYGRMVA
ncbi:hypothetical protein MVES_000100 [Malassezia vespertilionis]|uniref:Uncharacterized protein n=1 Tax=Malassezia vespertilionis TaxID=2020962 RepID=A0A2N1JG60_9BASI|nr:hypothetical protein MVES_000100 [Malassezia vespertilionis]